MIGEAGAFDSDDQAEAEREGLGVEVGAVGGKRDQGDLGRSEILDRGALFEDRLKQGGPGGPGGLGVEGVRGFLQRTTRGTPNAAADRITAPTFSGSWNGTNSVQPTGHSASGVHSAISGTRTTEQGGSGSRHVQSLEQGIGQTGSRPDGPRIRGALPPSSPSAILRPDRGGGRGSRRPLSGQAIRARPVLANSLAGQEVGGELVRRVRLAGDLADVARVGGLLPFLGPLTPSRRS